MQKAAFILIGIGILVLIGWSVKGFFMDSDISLLIKIAVGAVGVGVLILSGVAIKDRLKSRQSHFRKACNNPCPYQCPKTSFEFTKKCPAYDIF